MTSPIPIQLAVEDDLSEAVLRRILAASGRPYQVGTCYGHKGSGYLRKHIGGFNNAAKSTPWMVLTDLDKTDCAPRLRQEWLSVPQRANLLLRVAVRELEGWLLADAKGISRFFRIQVSKVPTDVEAIADPKAFLIDLARQSPNGELRSDIVPPKGSKRIIGPNYNGRMIAFVQEDWDISSAQQYAPSLTRAVQAVATFVPTWPQRD